MTATTASATSATTSTTSTTATVAYLKSLQAVRERSELVYQKAKQGELAHFSFNESRVDSVADYVISLIERDFGSINKVPTHGRWRSYCVSVDGAEKRDLVMEHVEEWKSTGVSEWECARRVIDLFVVSVLIDAGAGSKWRYEDKELGAFGRTEGLGIAALRMFENGLFSSSPTNPFQADAVALNKLADAALLDGFQVTDANPLLGVENRAELLRGLGRALGAGTAYFGGECACRNHPARPGFMLDYLVGCSETGKAVDIDDVWKAIIEGLAPVWPASRTQLDGCSLGDVWPCDTLAESASTGKAVDAACLVPFHKLSQWLTWSLLEVITKLGKFTVSGIERMTGLPEYRNGGLLVDMGVLTLNEEDRLRGAERAKGGIPTFEGTDPVIVEWRAMTVVLLDKVAASIRQKLDLDDGKAPDMFLGRVLEGGTWKAGREIAARLRSDTRDPPINIISDGTLF
ncbi:hypothetical protein GGI12_000495 [Dipsacomyces acuminosporus]|nr:hypothetical protein GGI12_000495 [Dipsacomyces acuminosporus]